MHQDLSNHSRPQQAVISPLFTHLPMSRDSLSSMTHSSSSLHTDDGPYETSSPVVNDADEIILRGYHCPTSASHESYDRGAKTTASSTSLWHDLDRDGVHVPAIPSFILNSPPIGPIRGVQ